MLVVTFHQDPFGFVIGLPFLHSTCSLSITDIGGPLRTGSSYLHADLHVFDITNFIIYIQSYGTAIPFTVVLILIVIYLTTAVVQVRSPLLLDSRLINLLELLRCFTSLLLYLLVGFPLRVSIALRDIPSIAYRMVLRPCICLCLRYPRKTLSYISIVVG